MSALPPTVVRLPFTPRKHQREAHALRQVFRFVVLVWHRRGGKTVFAIIELLLAALMCKRERGRFGYIAPLLRQAKEVAWDYLKAFGLLIPGAVANESELSLTLPSGTRIRLYGADNPDAFRGGYFDGVVLDEVADMRPQVWGEIIRPMLADRQGWALFIGTPKGINLFSELYFRALKDESRVWATDVRRAADTGALTAEEMEQARKEMSPSQWAQEMECDFNASVDDVLLRLEEVLEAQRRRVPREAFIYAARVLGVDCARYGDDDSALCPRQGIVAMPPRVLHGLGTMELAGQVAHYVEVWKPHAVMIDVGGIGAGVYDRCTQLGVNAIPVDFGAQASNPRFENKRAEMWWDMAQWVKGGGCLPDGEHSQRIQQDLAAPKITYRNRRGRMQLESKDDMRERGMRSPDIGDGYACTFAVPIAPPEMPDWPGRTASHVEHDFDPHAR